MNIALLSTLLAVVLLLVLVLKFKMHVFPALLIASFVAALVAGMPPEKAIETVQSGMGGTLGFIAVVVGLGALLGVLLEVSGGVHGFALFILQRLGIERGRWSMGIVGLVVSIPVFFDVALIMLMPVIKKMASLTKKPTLYFGLPLLIGLATAHAFIPPTPGPVAVSQLIGADIGLVILFGLLVGLPAMCIAGPLLTHQLYKAGHLGLAEFTQEQNHSDIDLTLVYKLLTAISAPIVLIVIGTMAKQNMAEGLLRDYLMLVGHPFVALLIACGLAYLGCNTQDPNQRKLLKQGISKAFEPTGAVILVTGAGGAFKQVLVETGAGNALAQVSSEAGLTPIAAGFTLAVLVRIAQGSATVAMITAGGLVAPIIATVQLAPNQVALVVIAIAAGASSFSHVNDSGFWLVNRYFQQTTQETLKTWSLAITLLGVVSFVIAILLSWVL